MQKVLVSACLLGAQVRYHGGDAASAHPSLRRWFEEGRLVSVCPETDGGLPTPRPPAEIIGSGGGRAVVSRLAVVRNSNAVDVTAAFINGAERALEVARAGGIRIAILKDGSPSCGSTSVYDGTFTRTRISEVGVTTALLRASGIRVFNEDQIDEAQVWLERLEATKK
jgi:uncharacterized protein YbbK (DUF523 family)